MALLTHTWLCPHLLLGTTRVHVDAGVSGVKEGACHCSYHGLRLFWIPTSRAWEEDDPACWVALRLDGSTHALPKLCMTPAVAWVLCS